MKAVHVTRTSGRGRIALALFAASLLAGCASLSSVALTRVPAERTRPVEASASSWAILGIYFSNSFAEDAVRELERQCPGGMVSGVYTKLEGRFYLFWTTRTVKARGYCLPPAAASAAAPGGRS
jgi:hypothetical protein